MFLAEQNMIHEPTRKIIKINPCKTQGCDLITGHSTKKLAEEELAVIT